MRSIEYHLSNTNKRARLAELPCLKIATCWSYSRSCAPLDGGAELDESSVTISSVGWIGKEAAGGPCSDSSEDTALRSSSFSCTRIAIGLWLPRLWGGKCAF